MHWWGQYDIPDVFWVISTESSKSQMLPWVCGSRARVTEENTEMKIITYDNYIPVSPTNDNNTENKGQHKNVKTKTWFSHWVQTDFMFWLLVSGKKTSGWHMRHMQLHKSNTWWRRWVGVEPPSTPISQLSPPDAISLSLPFIPNRKALDTLLDNHTPKST